MAASAANTCIDVPRLRHLAALGWYLGEIAAEFGVNRESARMASKRHGIAVRRHPAAHSPGIPGDFWIANDGMLLSLFDAGETFSAIAERLGTTKGAVAGRLYRLDRIGERMPRLAPVRQTPTLPPIGCCMYPAGADCCGDRAKPGSSYCSHHHRIVFRAPRTAHLKEAA